MKFNFLFILFLVSTNLNAIKIDVYNYLPAKGKEISQVVIKAAGDTKTWIVDSLEKSISFIDRLFIKFEQKDNFDKALAISAIAACASVTAYALKKIILDRDNKNNRDSELFTNNRENNKKLNEEVNKILENINFVSTGNIVKQEQDTQIGLDGQTRKFSLFTNTPQKWALWPEDMSFLAMIQIPQDIFFKRLITEIQTMYKGVSQETQINPNIQNTPSTQNSQISQNNNNNLNQAQFAVASFIKDVDCEMAEYQKKYNIILISDNFPRKHECLLKIKDNIKKLIYLKNTVTCWANNN